MATRDRPAILRRGAAPPSTRSCLWFLAWACALHAVGLSALWIKLKPAKEFAVAGGLGPHTRARLIRIAPLRSFPSPDAPEEAPKARPKPALMKRYQPGAKGVIHQERDAIAALAGGLQRPIPGSPLCLRAPVRGAASCGSTPRPRFSRSSRARSSIPRLRAPRPR